MESFNPVEWCEVYTCQTVALVPRVHSYKVGQSVDWLIRKTQTGNHRNRWDWVTVHPIQGAEQLQLLGRVLGCLWLLDMAHLCFLL